MSVEAKMKSVDHLKDMTKRLIIDSLVSGESFQCLKCEKEIKRDTDKAEFTTPHILIVQEEEYWFVCSTCYNRGKYRPKTEGSFFYRKCVNPRCSKRFYIPLDKKESNKYCFEACTKRERPELEKDRLYLHQVMLWQGQEYALYIFTKEEWCIMVQEKPKIWEVGFYLPASLGSVEKLAEMESEVTGRDFKQIQQKILGILKHSTYRHIIPKKSRRGKKK